jgi:hypothetical protein
MDIEMSPFGSRLQKMQPRRSCAPSDISADQQPQRAVFPFFPIGNKSESAKKLLRETAADNVS